MPKSSDSLATLPPIAAEALRKLGENLAIARARRKESQRTWARRLGVSIPTLIRLEQGEPSVSVGIYATALWLLGRVQALPELADPQHDRGALELDVRRAAKRRAVRSAASIRAQLAKSSARASAPATSDRETSGPVTSGPATRSTSRGAAATRAPAKGAPVTRALAKSGGTRSDKA